MHTQKGRWGQRMALLHFPSITDAPAPQTRGPVSAIGENQGPACSQTSSNCPGSWGGRQGTASRKKKKSRLRSPLYCPGYRFLMLLPLLDTKDLEEVFSRSVNGCLVSTCFAPSPWLNDKEIKHDRHKLHASQRGELEQTSTQMSKGNGERVKGCEKDTRGDVR